MFTIVELNVNPCSYMCSDEILLTMVGHS